MATCDLKIKVSMAWWWMPYVYGMTFIICLTGLQPDLEKLQRVVRRAIRVRAE